MRRTSIRFRLLSMMICLTTLPIIAFAMIATTNMRNLVEPEIINANTSGVMWSAEYLENIIEQLDRMFYSLQLNDELMDSMSKLDSDDIYVQYKTQNFMKQTLSTSLYTNSSKIDEFTLYVHEGHKSFTVSHNVTGKIDTINIENQPWNRLENIDTNIYFESIGQHIYAVHSINRFPDKKLKGGLAVRLDSNVLDKVFNILKSEEEGSIYLFNDEIDLLWGTSEISNTREIKHQVENFKNNEKNNDYIKTKDYYYFIREIDDGKLILIKAVPTSLIKMAEINTIKAGFVIAGIFVVISIVISTLFSLKISKPIVNLAKTMSKDLIHDLKVDSGQSIDEIILLENGYNSMIKRLKELIEEEYQHEIDLKNAQLVALQAQINPHFLNNTLQLIGGMALSKNIPEIYDITRGIGDLLRYSIDNNSNMVTINDELINIQNYLMIQQKRFEGRCKVKIRVSESVKRYLLPKFTLQPIVENAFQYGLQPKVGEWKLELRISHIGNRIAIMIKDSGVGIKEKDLKKIRGKLNNNFRGEVDKNTPLVKRKGTGIGLRNVDSRLKLKFGKGFGVRIFSSEGLGTLVVLIIKEREWEGQA